MDFYQILVLIGGAMIVFTTLPQLLKIIKTKKIDDLSLNMFLILIIAEGIWLYYGFHLNDLPLTLTNGLAMVVVATNIGLILKYRMVTDK